MADIRERIEFLKKNPQMRGFSPEQLDRIIDREKEKARFEQTQGTKPQVVASAPSQISSTFATLPGQTTQQEIEYFRRTNPQFADRQRFTDLQIRNILNERKSQNFVSQPKPSATTAAATTAAKIIPPKIFTPDTKPRTVIATTATTAVPTTTTATTATVVDTATSQEEFYKKTIADLTKQLETAIGKVEAQPGASVDVEKISR